MGARAKEKLLQVVSPQEGFWAEEKEGDETNPGDSASGK